MTMAVAAEDRLLFLPLGGANEIGMNLNLYGCRGKWLMVDLGLTFADETLPGIDVVVPDPSFIEADRDNLLALVLTHAHEDHLGAVPHLWRRLRCPIYATGFTAALLRRKLQSVGLGDQVPVFQFEPGQVMEFGPFKVRALSITHSIPESTALVIDTPFGTVLHSGDWKLDPEPLIGPVTDDEALNALGEGGVLALVCDSTNVFRPGQSGSEGAVRASLLKLLSGRATRIAITTFASNVARIDTVAKVAEALDRHLVLVGRALQRVTEAAQANGYLADLKTIDERAAGYLPPDKVVYLCTGCQGEPRGAMARIANGTHPAVSLDPGDLVVFSSRIIPGNERSLYALHNRLVKNGIEVMTERDHFVHVSGHPSREELATMYRWIRPRIAVPVHGEARHVREHAAFARSLQVPEAVEVQNGDLLQLAPGPARIVDQVPAGRLAVEGEMLVPVEGELMRRRRRLMYNGVAQVVLVVDQGGRLAAPARVVLLGVAEGESVALGSAVQEAVEATVTRLPSTATTDDGEIGKAAQMAVQRMIKAIAGRRPLIEVQVVRLGTSEPMARPLNEVSA